MILLDFSAANTLFSAECTSGERALSVTPPNTLVPGITLTFATLHSMFTYVIQTYIGKNISHTSFFHRVCQPEQRRCLGDFERWAELEVMLA